MAAPTEQQMSALFAIASGDRPDGRVSISLAVGALLVRLSELEAIERRAQGLSSTDMPDAVRHVARTILGVTP
jgi:hypothetical protein